MKAVVIHEYGGPEVLSTEQVADPILRPGQVLVRVRACSLNHIDLWVRSGSLSGGGVTLPHIPGSDAAGEIVELGPGETGLRVGQRVLVAPLHFCTQCRECMAGRQNRCREFTVRGNGTTGTNCELIAVPAAAVIPIPDDLSHEQAASVPLAFLTSWHMLAGRAGITTGQTVLILGGGSGIGVAAIQIAKMFHARVITTVGDSQKASKALALGADHVIDHYRQDVSAEVQRLTDQEGCDIVFEHVGAATWNHSLGSLKYGGTIVTCGATTGAAVAFDLRPVYRKQLSILGSYLGTMGELHEVLRHIFAGRLRAVIDRTLPLSEIHLAHAAMAGGGVFGKLVVTL